MAGRCSGPGESSCRYRWQWHHTGEYVRWVAYLWMFSAHVIEVDVNTGRSGLF